MPGMHPESAANHREFLAAIYGVGLREGLVLVNLASGLNVSAASDTCDRGMGPFCSPARRRNPGRGSSSPEAMPAYSATRVQPCATTKASDAYLLGLQAQPALAPLGGRDPG